MMVLAISPKPSTLLYASALLELVALGTYQHDGSPASSFLCLHFEHTDMFHVYQCPLHQCRLWARRGRALALPSSSARS